MAFESVKSLCCKPIISPYMQNTLLTRTSFRRTGPRTSFQPPLHCQPLALARNSADENQHRTNEKSNDGAFPRLGLIERVEKASQERRGLADTWENALPNTTAKPRVQDLSRYEELRWGALVSLTMDMENVRDHLLEMETRHAAALIAYESHRRKSLENFLHWIALRNINMQGVQTRLSAFGLSSLSWSDSHILHSVNCVIRGLRSLLALELISRVPHLLENRSLNHPVSLDWHLSPTTDTTTFASEAIMPPTAAAELDSAAEALQGGVVAAVARQRTGSGGFDHRSGGRSPSTATTPTSVPKGAAGLRGNARREASPQAAAAATAVASDVVPEVAMGLGDWLEEGAEEERGFRAMTLEAGRAMLRRNAEDLLGPEPGERRTRIMVTLPAEAATDKELVLGLVAAGMNVARVNCAHDSPDVWEGMVANVRDASAQLGVTCRILMDLAGPKLRTGCLAPGPKVAKIRPSKSIDGRVLAPARVWLSCDGASPLTGEAADMVLPLDGNSTGLVKSLRPGDLLEFEDTRGKSRRLRVSGREEGLKGVWAQSMEVAYVSSETVFRVKKVKRGKGKRGKKGVVSMGDLPALEVPIGLEMGDTLVLTQEDAPGCPAVRDNQGRVVTPAHVACTLPAAYESVRPGEVVLLDDGKIKSVVRLVTSEKMVLEVRHANGQVKLRGEKSINFPESDLKLKGLTAKDMEDLTFISKHADMVAYSFVNDADDVEILQDELEKLNAGHLGIVLKIETRTAFENLPQMLFQGYRRGQPLGVMIARGDLFVEVGWEAMGEVQDQILWMCEAAHVPTIWATQVLENLAKTGAPSRPEITDAVSSQRAECVMLNKGPHIMQAVSSLGNILQSAGHHHAKKQPRLQPLPVCKEFEIL